VLSDSDKIAPVPQDDLSEDEDEDDPPPAGGKAKTMAGERVVFTEENSPHQYVKLLASGDVDEILLDAIEDYVKRQKKRLAKAKDDEAAN